MPPPVDDAVSPLRECVNQVGEIRAGRPLATTVNSTQARGISATTTDRVTSTVAAVSLTRRRPLTRWKAGGLTGEESAVVDVEVVDMDQSFFPATIMRAAALTTKVSTKSTRPAAM